MVEPLILRKDDKPTYFNKEMAIGFFINPVIGTIVGGIIGKKRMEHEFTEGKIVRKPSAVNKSALLGGLIGANAGALVSMAVLMATTTAVSAAGIAAVGGLLPIAAIAMPAAIIIGAFIGGKKGKETQQNEYALAIQQSEEGIRVEPSIRRGLEQAYEQNLNQHHAEEILRKRAEAQALQKQL